MGYAYVEHIEHPGTQPPFLEDLSHPLAIVTGVCFTVAAILTDALTVRVHKASSVAALIRLLADLPTLHDLGTEYLGLRRTSDYPSGNDGCVLDLSLLGCSAHRILVCGFVMCAVTQEAGSEVMLYGTSAG